MNNHKTILISDHVTINHVLIVVCKIAKIIFNQLLIPKLSVYIG